MFVALLITTTLVRSVAGKDLIDFDYRVDINKGIIAFQYYQNAPYPFDSEDQQEVFTTEMFKQALGKIKVKEKELYARYFGGWIFIVLGDDYDFDSWLPILEALKRFKNGEQTDTIKDLFKLSAELKAICEEQNLQNPYAGLRLDADYGAGGTPSDDVFVPTATFMIDTDRLLQSLAFVYGGTLQQEKHDTKTFQHGDDFIYSYQNEMTSSYSKDRSIRGDFRQSDDGKVANQKLRLTSFPTWF